MTSRRRGRKSERVWTRLSKKPLLLLDCRRRLEVKERRNHGEKGGGRGGECRQGKGSTSTVRFSLQQLSY
jgi:hypothetical protein